MRDVEVECALVDPLPLSDGEDVEAVAVVRDDDDPGVDVSTVDGHAKAARMSK